MATSVNDETLREAVRQWLSENWTQELADELSHEPMTLDAASPARRSWLAKVLDAGWSVLRWPEEWFGRALSDDQARIVEHEFARVGAPGTGQDRVNLWANTLLAEGQQGLKEKLIGPLLRNEVTMSSVGSSGV